MTHYHLKIEPFEMLNEVKLTGIQQVNEHGVVNFSGIVPAEKEDEYTKKVLGSTSAKVYSVDLVGGGEELWFWGVVTEISISSEDGLKTLSATLHTGTYLMDVRLHTRSYQNPGMTYNEVLATYTDSYPTGSFIMKVGSGETINKLIMQYRETDWTFTRRLSTHFKSVLIPDCLTGGVKYYFGIKKSSPVATIQAKTYEMRKNASDYKIKKNQGVSLDEVDTINYIYQTKEIYRLGDCVEFNDKQMYVSRIETAFDRSDLTHTYFLKSLEGFQVPKEYNTQANGVSFRCNITAVEKDVVQVSIIEDENKEGCGVRWFPYSTVYSTPDGTGWFCMPEVDDEMRLYIPDEDEAGAYVISATHLTSAASDERCNPDFKSIMNKYHKEVLFTPDSLIFTNNNGMSVEILDEEGIKIISDKIIKIESDEAIHIASTESSITVTSPKSITFKQGDTVTHLEKNISFDGSKIHMD